MAKPWPPNAGPLGLVVETHTNTHKAVCLPIVDETNECLEISKPNQTVCNAICLVNEAQTNSLSVLSDDNLEELMERIRLTSDDYEQMYRLYRGGV